MLTDWWKPEQGDPYWMLEVRQGFDDAGAWLRNQHSCLTTRDPVKALRYPSAWHANTALQSLHNTNSGRFEATEHAWVSTTATEDSGEVVQADRWQSDRERLEAVASTDDMALAVNLRERLVELGHDDIARRQALLLDLVVNVFSRHRLSALSQSPDSLVEALVCNCKDAHGNKPRADCPYCKGTNIIADSPGLDGYEPKRKVGASGYGWLAGAIDPNATEAEKLRLELYCMNERRKTQVAQTRYHRERADALEQELTALSSGNEVAKVVGWLLSLDRDEWYPSDVADALVRGDHLASDAAPLTGG